MHSEELTLLDFCQHKVDVFMNTFSRSNFVYSYALIKLILEETPYEEHLNILGVIRYELEFFEQDEMTSIPRLIRELTRDIQAIEEVDELEE